MHPLATRSIPLFAILLLASVAIAQQKLPPYPVIVTAAPFSARITSTTYEKLADGTQVAHETESWEARNNQGWQWSKHIVQDKDALRRDGKKYIWYVVWNPIHHTRTEWCDCRKIAYTKPYGDPRPERLHQHVNSSGMDVYLGSVTDRLKYRLTPIEGQVLQGEPTDGTQALRTVPAGVDGNDRDLRWSIRSWYSPRLHLAMFTIVDDPFKGLTKHEVLDLKTTEPDPGLFLVPEGYQVLPAPEVVR